MKKHKASNEELQRRKQNADVKAANKYKKLREYVLQKQAEGISIFVVKYVVDRHSNSHCATTEYLGKITVGQGSIELREVAKFVRFAEIKSLKVWHQ